MQVEAALLWWRHKNKHVKCCRARVGGGRPGGWGGGGGGGGRYTVPIGIHVPVYMNRVLPKLHKEVSSYILASAVLLERACSSTPEKKSCMNSLTPRTGWINT